MVPRRLLSALFVLAVFGAVLVARPVPTPAGMMRASEPARALSLPLMFEPDSDGRSFFARSRGYAVRVRAAGATLTPGGSSGAGIDLRFDGGRGDVRPERGLPTRVNHLRGSARQWRTGVPAFARVRLTGVYPGVDAVFYGTDRDIEYDLIVAPGASPQQIRLRFDGADAVDLDATNLRLRSGGHTLTQRAPVAYQEIEGRRVPVAARYTVATDGSVGFSVGRYDASAALVIDPTIVYSTYFGGSDADNVFAITTDVDRNAYLAGAAQSGDYPIVAGRPYAAVSDAYIAKIRPDGTAEWVTFLGGDRTDMALAIALGPTGDLYTTGEECSAEFPTTTGVYRQVSGTDCDTFVARVAPDGTLKYATLLGAPQPWEGAGGAGIVVDPQGRAVVTGTTASPGFVPTIASFGPVGPNLDQPDVFVARFSEDGARLDWSRLIAGSGFDYGKSIARDQFGNFYVTGATTSADFPTRNAFNAHKFEPGDADGQTGYDGFLAAIWEDGTLGFSTYLGGYGEDAMNTVVVGQFDRPYVGGTTNSPDSTTPPAPGTPSQGIVYEIIPTSTGGVVRTARPAGTGLSAVTSLAVGSDFGIWIAGFTDGAGWPLNSPDEPVPQRSPGGGLDMFVQRQDPQLDGLWYSFLFGGSGDDRAFGIALDRLGDIYLAGDSSSANYPVQSAAQPARHGTGVGNTDGAVTKIACYVKAFLPVGTQPAAGGDGSLGTYAAPGCAIEAVSDSPWLHVTGLQDRVLHFTADPNPTASERHAAITLSSKTIAPITQAAAAGGGGASSHDEIVLNPRDVSSAVGDWRLVPDEVHGAVMTETDRGAPKVGAAAAFPGNWFELTFTADAGKPYHLWIHGRAENDSWQNDSVYVQFSDSLDAAGHPIFRRQTSSATWVSLEECSGCGERGWGWQDNAYGARGDLGPDIYFATSGTHTILLQQREDGFSIGQIVLSAKAFLRTAPGGNLNDPTIVTAPSPAAPPPPLSSRDEIVLWAATDAAAVSGTWARVADPTAAGQAAIANPDAGTPKLTAPLAAPANYIDLTFDADAGKAYHLWLRMQAGNDAWTNDSVWVQFSGAVDAAGTPMSRIGTTAGTWVSLEECSGCGEHGWGWQDNAYGSPGDLGGPVYFAASGPQTIRIQVREDGVAVDQVVLSAVRYTRAAPGTARDDATILPRTPR